MLIFKGFTVLLLHLAFMGNHCLHHQRGDDLIEEIAGFADRAGLIDTSSAPFR
jgi:hypothetical protein